MRSCKYKDESALKRAIVDYLRAIGYFCWRAGAGPYQQAGIPDIPACSPQGRFVAIEAKMPGEKPTRLQEKTLDALRANNAIVIVAYSVDDVRAALERRKDD